MGKIDLQISCKLDNVRDLLLSEDEEWWFTTKCTNCQEANNTKIYFTLMEVFDIVDRGV